MPPLPPFSPRQEREAKALRDNLKRRKEQVKARKAAHGSETPSSYSPKESPS